MDMPELGPRRLVSNCVILLLLCCCICSDAAFIEFRNCLDNNIVNSTPQLLQFVPLNATASFDLSSDTQNLNVTIYGNVTGRQFEDALPPPDDPSWTNPNETRGKIPDVGANFKYTTLFARYDVLSYTPWQARPQRFCDAVRQVECPVAPAFYVNQTDIAQLPAFTVANDMFSTYAFTSITATMRIRSGDVDGRYFSCVTATMTPDLGSTLKGLLRYLPLAILIMVGIATIFAAILSPWGSSDIFHWTSNFGRDEDLLRLVTPGFADCLQYIQFIVLTGSLSLSYPGFYQPAVSRVAWSSLMFNQSLVTHGNGTQTVVDGIYQYGHSSDHGLDRMSNLVGMTAVKDMWAGMIVWLVVITVAVCVLTQIAFVARWIYRQVASVEPEDLRSKNGPFTAGNAIRVCMNYFLLPLTALSFYQLVIASRGPTYAVALAAITIVLVLCFSTRLLFLFIRIRPRSFLFDDLQTVLAYGPLYNTYCDDAGTFALIPIFVNLLRGIAIGAVQQSGVAQVVLLAICEIILILTVNAFRPFPSATSMNIYHTCFSVIRLITVLLSIAFVPSLEVGDSSRGWIGYAILLIHACVLVFGFFLNAIQTLIEVIARLAGAGGRDDVNGEAARGGLTKVFGMRQLSRRLPRHQQAPRSSMNSNAAILTRMEDEQKELQMAKTRSHSVSASSTMLLDSGNRNPARFSQNLDGMSGGQTTPDASSTFSGRRLTNRFSDQSAGGIVGLQKVDSKDPYYRPPRRNTMEPMQSPDQPTVEPAITPGPSVKQRSALEDEAGEGTSTPARVEREDLEDVVLEGGRSKKDYAVREVDFYYGVRGPALSSGTRRLKTGPADPTGPVSSATGWFKNMFGAKTKEKHKGFEVVRSARAPPPGLFPTPEVDAEGAEPYRDEPQTPALAGRSRADASKNRVPGEEDRLYSDEAVDTDSDEEFETPTKVSPKAPSLPLIDTVGGIELPSRMGSETSKKSKKRQKTRPEDVPAVPAVPRRSSRRNSSRDIADSPSRIPRTKLAPVEGSPNGQRGSNATLGSGRLPFASNQASPSKPSRYSMGHESTTSDYMQPGDEENKPPGPSYTQHLRHSSSALGDHAVGDRPSSVGFVQQHRASDNIHYSPDSPEFEGSIAEVHYGRPAKR
jgi:Transient receptor potential (TRP) ion channel/ML-like domain